MFGGSGFPSPHKSAYGLITAYRLPVLPFKPTVARRWGSFAGAIASTTDCTPPHRIEDCFKGRHCTQQDMLYLSNALKSGGISVESIVQACSCLRFLKPRDAPAATVFIGILADSLHVSLSCSGGVLPVRLVCECLTSLKHFRCHTVEMKRLLIVLADQLRRSTDLSKLRNRHISGALFGLRRMSGDTPEVRELLGALDGPLVVPLAVLAVARER